MSSCHVHAVTDDFCTAYLDDILVYSEDPLEHFEHVRKVLRRLREAGLQADIRKSEFRTTRTVAGANSRGLGGVV